MPILDGTNFSEWQMRMEIHLCSKDLMGVCEREPAEDASSVIVNRWTNLSYEAVGVITSQINQTVFISVMNNITKKNSARLWAKINECYASMSALNRGRV